MEWLQANWGLLVAALGGLLGLALTVSLMIPGDQPDKFLQGAVDFIKKFSKK